MWVEPWRALRGPAKTRSTNRRSALRAEPSIAPLLFMIGLPLPCVHRKDLTYPYFSAHRDQHRTSAQSSRSELVNMRTARMLVLG